jgi:acetyl-CoA acetyltransferase
VQALKPLKWKTSSWDVLTPEGATGANIARQIALKAGLPVSVSGLTVNRFCSSGLQTIALAAQRIIAGRRTSMWLAV